MKIRARLLIRAVAVTVLVVLLPALASAGLVGLLRKSQDTYVVVDIDPTTGVMTELGASSVIGQVSAGASTMHSDNLLIGGDSISQFETLTGSLVSDSGLTAPSASVPEIPLDFQSVGNNVWGLFAKSGTIALALVLTDGSTIQVQTHNISFTDSGLSTLDTAEEKIFFAAQAEILNVSSWRLYQLRLPTGEFVRAPAIDPVTTIPATDPRPLVLVTNPDTGQINAVLRKSASEHTLGFIDTNSGSTSTFGSWTAYQHTAGIAAVEPVALNGAFLMYYIARATDDGPNSIFTVNLTSSTATSQVLTGSTTDDILALEHYFPLAAADPGSIGNSLQATNNAGALDLSWDVTCVGNETAYNVYGGLMTDFLSYSVSTACGVTSTTSVTLGLDSVDRFYLVVPQTATAEGSFGTNSAGTDRFALATVTTCQATVFPNECP